MTVKGRYNIIRTFWAIPVMGHFIDVCNPEDQRSFDSPTQVLSRRVACVPPRLQSPLQLHSLPCDSCPLLSLLIALPHLEGTVLALFTFPFLA